MTDKPENMFSIGFVGGGHLSVVSAVAALEKTAVSGNQIWCYSDSLIEPPVNGVEEPGLLDGARTHTNRLKWTTKIEDLKLCDLVYFALDVPTDAAGTSALEPVQDLLGRLLLALNDKAILVNLSQVPPGWTRAINFPKPRLFYQVETLIFGQALNRALNPERFIVGSADKTQSLPNIYREFLEKFNCPIAVMAYESAELAKISINLYLASMVTTTNMLADLCTKVGASWQDIVPSLRLDPRIGPLAYLSPGLGLTSGNIKRDMITTKNIARQLGVQAGVVDAMLADSEYRMGWTIHQLKRLGFFKAMSTPNTIAILGLTYKPNTPIIAGSAAEQVLSLLPKGTIVRAFDPMPIDLPLVSFLSLTRCKTPEEAILNVSLVMILTPNQDIATLDWASMAKKMEKTWVLDPFGVLNPEHYPMLSIWQLGVRGPEKICL
jgi:UDPglucose 6-dehydrogenase